jgi:hypothetical protein
MMDLPKVLAKKNEKKLKKWVQVKSLFPIENLQEKDF